ncbi:hypothetical protein P154DRAFT_578898 [Amniculicola lignicola CBS 123094]|uniref:Uncharacterized protein n=1 Tax=Amniculicola lignicola CBS 123094 TaxID=1392246 RepID=A0A6A5W6E9_9PLEO|nr:hypothetical protein P154DRAFT_578898 [Amniculicola lignicola CBS 123094]
MPEDGTLMESGMNESVSDAFFASTLPGIPRLDGSGNPMDSRQLTGGNAWKQILRTPSGAIAPVVQCQDALWSHGSWGWANDTCSLTINTKYTGGASIETVPPLRFVSIRAVVRTQSVTAAEKANALASGYMTLEICSDPWLPKSAKVPRWAWRRHSPIHPTLRCFVTFHSHTLSLPSLDTTLPRVSHPRNRFPSASNGCIAPTSAAHTSSALVFNLCTLPCVYAPPRPPMPLP